MIPALGRTMVVLNLLLAGYCLSIGMFGEAAQLAAMNLALGIVLRITRRVV
jgi:hypothetical protein